MEIKWLKDFLKLAEVGNFTRAAEYLNSSQTALSRRIQSLEAWLGVKLVDRTIFPTRLTPEGELFRHSAAEILKHVTDAKDEVRGAQRVDHLRIALPYAVATSTFPLWWKELSAGLNTTCKIELGNVHDMMMALATDAVDVLICFQHKGQTVHLDKDVFDQKEICQERLAPYAAPMLGLDAQSFRRSNGDNPLPLLAYSRGVYLGGIVERMIETSELNFHTRTIIECDMSDVLRDMAVAGMGVVWLLESTAAAAGAGKLIRLEEPALTTEISIVALCKRANGQPAVGKLWARI